MIQIDIPGKGLHKINHVVFDYNGTIAKDGQLIPGVKKGINEFSNLLTFHVITADTFGSVRKELNGVNAVLTVISNDDQDQKKLEYLKTLGPDQTLSAGNGINDSLMLKESCIGIAVLGEEGLASSSFSASDLIVKHILDIFSFFKTPDRLIATLRR